MTKKKFISILMVFLLLFSVVTPAYAEQIVGVPFTSAPSPDDVFLQTGIASDAWDYLQSTIGSETPSDFCNQILIDFGPNWASHPEAVARYCYVFSGAPNLVYEEFYEYPPGSEDVSAAVGFCVLPYSDYNTGEYYPYFDKYVVDTSSFVFASPYAIAWNDGVTTDTIVTANTYTNPSLNVTETLTLYTDSFTWPNDEYTYEMSVSIYDGNYTDYPVIQYANSGGNANEYLYIAYEGSSQFQMTFRDDADFVFGDGVGTPDINGDIDLEGVENRLDEIIDNQHEQIDKQDEQSGILAELRDLITAMQETGNAIKDKVLEIANTVTTLPDTLAEAIANALENIEVGSDSGNGRNFFDMIVDVIDRIMDFFENAFDGIIAFAQSILEYIAAIGEVVVDYLLNALTQLGSILELILLVPNWLTSMLSFLPAEFASFISTCVSILFVAVLIRFAINIIK